VAKKSSSPIAQDWEDKALLVLNQIFWSPTEDSELLRSRKNDAGSEVNEKAEGEKTHVGDTYQAQERR
jgi:hypothetical protein